MKSAAKVATFGSPALALKEQLNNPPKSERPADQLREDDEKRRRRMEEKTKAAPGQFVRTSEAGGGPMLKNIMGV